MEHVDGANEDRDPRCFAGPAVVGANRDPFRSPMIKAVDQHAERLASPALTSSRVLRRHRRRDAGRSCLLRRACCGALTLAAVFAAGAGADDYSLLGPLRERDMTPLHLTRLEMMPTESSAALGKGWTIEADLTHTNTFAKTSLVRGFLISRGSREPFTAADATPLLSKHRDLLYLDGQLGLLPTTSP